MGTVNQKAKKPALLLREGVTMLDGGMGTLLQARGLKPGEKPETWALTHPEEVTAIHRAYYEAGSRIVSANTFGASRLHYPDSHTGRNLLILGDSFARCIAEPLSSHFDTTYVFYQGAGVDLGRYYDRFGITDVLVLMYSDRLLYTVYDEVNWANYLTR